MPTGVGCLSKSPHKRSLDKGDPPCQHRLPFTGIYNQTRTSALAQERSGRKDDLSEHQRNKLFNLSKNPTVSPINLTNYEVEFACSL